MPNPSSSALSKLINRSPLHPVTSVELLRFRQLASGIVIPEACEISEDEIVNSLAGERIPNKVGCETLALSKDDTSEDAPYLQILFLSSLRNEQGCTTSSVKIEPSLLLAICIQLGVTVNFLDGVLKPSIWSKQSGGCFHRYGADGEVEAIDGFYHYFNQWDLGPLHTWFSYQVKSKCTTYILFDCPLAVKEKLIAGDFLPQALGIDLLIAEECAAWREEFINEHYKQIFNWHENDGSMDPPLNRHINALDSLQTLHQLSRTWNMIYEDLGDLEERLDFLLSTATKLDSARITTQSIVEHLTFVKARTHLRRRWVTSFGERTKLIINFVFSLASQENSQANVNIAATTSIIAKETQRDNSSMMTIAMMTMLFLPGAFVATVLQMENNLWKFFVITIPATVVVLAVYEVWRRTREARMAKGSENAESDSSIRSIRAVQIDVTE